MVKIFVGSSNAASRQATLFIEGSSNPNVTYLPWWEQFKPGSTLLDELDRIRQSVHAAILILSPEAVATNAKGTEVVVPNQNVLFEFGYFYATLGKTRKQVLQARVWNSGRRQNKEGRQSLAR